MKSRQDAVLPVAVAALMGAWALTFSVFAGILLGGHDREHAAQGSVLGKVESSVGDVASNVGEIKSAVAQIESSVAEVAPSIRALASELAKIKVNGDAASVPLKVEIGDIYVKVTADKEAAKPNGDPHRGSTEPNSPNSPAAVKSIGCVKFRTGLHAIDCDKQRKAIESAVAHAMNDSGDILVLGLADSCGPATQNLDLSERRAESVANELLEKLTDRTIHVFGLGEGVGPFGEEPCKSQKHRTARMFLLPPDGAPD